MSDFFENRVSEICLIVRDTFREAGYPVDAAEIKIGIGRYLVTLAANAPIADIPPLEVQVRLEEMIRVTLDCDEVQLFPFQAGDQEIDVLLEGLDYPEPNPALVGEALYAEAEHMVRAAGWASTSFLQRRLRIGYSKAASLMDQLQDRGVIEPPNEASLSRRVLAAGPIDQSSGKI